jgi:ferredoxin
MLNGDPASILVGADGLLGVIQALGGAGYDVWVPAVRDGVVVTRQFREGDRLPVGYASSQAPGAYELVPTGDRTHFGWAVGPQPWKPLLHPPSVTTMSMTQASADAPVNVAVATRPAQPLALFGLRPCDLAAIERLDHVLLDRPPTEEPTYRDRRGDAFLVVVNCGVPASTCFCTSMETGPHVVGRSTSHDLEVTELVGASLDDEPDYLIEPISTRGAELLALITDRVDWRVPDDADGARVSDNRERACDSMQRHLPQAEVASVLVDAHDSDRWAEVVEQCLACGNCTSVCPTCFCTTINDVGDLAGTRVDRQRVWESCFSLEFSRLGDSTVRSSLASRYRQWMTHKLGTWHDQFGESGCVGCGRCTTWCPTGIDFVDVAAGFLAETGRERP